MQLPAGDLSSLVLRRSVRERTGEYSLDSQMLRLLMELDGTQPLGAVAQRLDLVAGTLRATVAALADLDLVEPVPDAVPLLPSDFLDYLRGQLALAIGPIADVILEDAVADLGHAPHQVPRHRAAELVSMVATEIAREDKQTAFKQNMLRKIQALAGA